MPDKTTRCTVVIQAITIHNWVSRQIIFVIKTSKKSAIANLSGSLCFCCSLRFSKGTCDRIALDFGDFENLSLQNLYGERIFIITSNSPKAKPTAGSVVISGTRLGYESLTDLESHYADFVSDSETSCFFVYLRGEK